MVCARVRVCGGVVPGGRSGPEPRTMFGLAVYPRGHNTLSVRPSVLGDYRICCGQPFVRADGEREVTRTRTGTHMSPHPRPTRQQKLLSRPRLPITGRITSKLMTVHRVLISTK